MELTFRINHHQSATSSNQLHLGVGVFDTFVARQILGWGVFRISDHLERFCRSLRTLELIELDPESLLESIREFSRDALPAFSDLVRIRLVGNAQGVDVQFFDWRPDWCHRGIKLLSVKSDRFLPEIKSSSALPSYLARRQAEKSGADEALLIDSNGQVKEGAWSNFFWVDAQNAIHTAGTKILPGITRAEVLSYNDQFNFIQDEFKLSEVLNRAVDAFISQATNGVVPVSEIDGHILPSSTCAQTIQMRYENSVKTNSFSLVD